MEIYKNDYDEREDYMLWELHEIRHELREEHKNESIAEINKRGRELVEEWKARRQASHRE